MKRLALIAVLHVLSVSCLFSSIEIDSSQYFFDDFYTVDNPVDIVTLDSIAKHLKFSEIKEQIDVYNYFAVLYNDYSLVKTFEYCQKALKLSDSCNYIKGKMAALKSLSFHHVYNGQYDSALKYSNIFWDLCSKSKNKHDLAQAYIMNGFINYFSLREYKKAFNSYFKALEIYEGLKDDFGLAICFQNIGRSYLFIKSYDEALKYFYKSLAYFRKTKPVYECKLHLWIANTYRHMNDQENCFDNLKAAKIILEEYDAIGIKLFYLRDMGIYYNDMLGEYDSSFKYYNQAIEISKKYQNYFHLGNLYTLIANMYIDQKQIENGLKYNFLALEARKKQGVNYLISSSLLNIGSLYLDYKSISQAYDYLIQGLKLAEKISYRIYIRRAYHLLYQYYKKQATIRKASSIMRNTPKSMIPLQQIQKTEGLLNWNMNTF